MSRIAGAGVPRTAPGSDVADVSASTHRRTGFTWTAPLEAPHCRPGTLNGSATIGG